MKILLAIRNIIVKILGGYTLDRYPSIIRTRIISIIEREEQILRREKSIRKSLGN